LIKKDYIARKKRNYLPFHDTWGSRTIITEIYTKPDFVDNYHGPIWSLLEYGNTVYIDAFFIYDKNYLSGKNGVFGERESSNDFFEISSNFECDFWEEEYCRDEGDDDSNEGVEEIAKEPDKEEKRKYSYYDERWSRGPPLAFCINNIYICIMSKESFKSRLKSVFANWIYPNPGDTVLYIKRDKSLGLYTRDRVSGFYDDRCSVIKKDSIIEYNGVSFNIIESSNDFVWLAESYTRIVLTEKKLPFKEYNYKRGGESTIEF